MAIQMRQPKVVERGRSYPAGTIPALAALLDELAAEGIRFCLWKSNLHLAEALAGLTDLDLLVQRDQVHRFREIVLRHGAKPIVPPPGGRYPGLEHFLGLDAPTGRQFHLHVHDRLVLGQRYVKNHHLPLESAFLDSVRVLEGVPVPRPELELAVLAVRALLKYRARDVVKDALGIRSPGIPSEMQAEIRWLIEQTTVAQVRATLRETGEIVPAGIVCDLLETVERDPRSGYTLFRLRGRLTRAMRRWERRGRLRARVKYLRFLWLRRRRFRLRPFDPRMTPANGGRTIALVGADGSGKSTLVEALVGRLGWKLQVRSYYMGSKAPSRVSQWLYVAFRALRRGHRSASGRIGTAVARPIAAARDGMLALHYLSIGRDRARRYREAEEDARAGRVVIFDRYPLETLSNEPLYRLLDGPQIADALGDSIGPITSLLARREERIYRRFRLPDSMVVLQVSPEVSVLRKPDHLPDMLAAKSRATLDVATLAEANGEVDVIRIDADRPLDEVLLDLEARLWDVL